MIRKVELAIIGFNFFGTHILGFDNPHKKKLSFCSHGEMDITIDFGSIFEGSNPSGSTIKPL